MLGFFNFFCKNFNAVHVRHWAKWLLLCSNMLSISTFASTPWIVLETQVSSQNPWFMELKKNVMHEGSHRFFLDTQGAFSFTKTNNYMEGGCLYHYRYNSRRVLGAYVYTEFNNSLQHQFFWTLNPGMEFLHPDWHVNWNAYLPLNTSMQKNGSSNIAMAFGISQFQYFQFHQQYDATLQPANVTGPGTDFIVDYKLPVVSNMALSLGSYYFYFAQAPVNSPSNMLGGIVKLNTPTYQHVQLSLGYSYDTINHNTVSFAFKFYPEKQQDSPSNWFNQPIQHDIATLGQANSIPIVNGFVPINHHTLVRDNIWFFAPNTGLQNTDNTMNLSSCTYEHPCTNLGNIATGSIAGLSATSHFKDDPSLYIQPGNYTFNDAALYLYGNESLVGRTQNYAFPSSGNERATLNLGQVILWSNYDNSNNTLANLQLVNTGIAGFSTIVVVGTETTSIDNLKIGVMDSRHPEQNYLSALQIVDHGQVNLTNSELNVNNYFNPYDDHAIAIKINGDSTLNISNTQINLSAEENTQDISGIFAYSGVSHININHSQITLNQQYSGTSTSVSAVASDIAFNDDLNIDLFIEDSTLTTTIHGSGFHGNNVQLSGNSQGSIVNSVLESAMNDAQNNYGAFNIDLFQAANLDVIATALRAVNTHAQGGGAATNLNLTEYSSASVTGSNFYSSGDNTVVTGTTNITAGDDSYVVLNKSTFNTEFAGGAAASGQSPSGAVALWVINRAKLEANQIDVNAVSNNNETFSVAIQTENDAEAIINRSQLISNSVSGSAIPIRQSTVTAGNNSKITIQNSSILGESSGNSASDLCLVLAIDNGHIDIGYSTLIADNKSTSQTGQNATNAAVADGSGALISLHQDAIKLIGDQTSVSVETNGGQVNIS